MSKIAWLQVSDWHQGTSELGWDPTHTLDELLRDIRERTRRVSPAVGRLNFVVFSGDLAYSGERDEFEAAWKTFLHEVLVAAEVPKTNLVIVPGNHDVNRSQVGGLSAGYNQPFVSEKQLENALIRETTRSRLMRSLAGYSEFVTQTLEMDGDPAAARWQKFTSDADGVTVGVISLNSAFLCGRYRSSQKEQHRDYGNLAVGDMEIGRALKEIEDCDLKVAVLHHPLDALAEFERRLIPDYLGQECEFVLHGHDHRPGFELRVGSAGQEYLYIEAGATYWGSRYRKQEYFNSYNYVVVDTDACAYTVHLRQYDDGRHRFVVQQTYSGPASGIDLLRRLRSRQSGSLVASRLPLYLRARVSRGLAESNLPPNPPALKGRADELKKLLGLIRDGTRAVGIHGAPGAGVSSFTVQVGRSLQAEAESFIAVLVQLSSWDSTDVQVLRTIARAIDLRESRDKSLLDQIATAISGQRYALLLDGWKDGIHPAGVLNELLECCPGLTLIIAGARAEASRCTGFELRPLDLPVAGQHVTVARLRSYHGVALMVDLALQQVSKPSTNGDMWAAAREACEVLGGWPVQIQLLAAEVSDQRSLRAVVDELLSDSKVTFHSTGTSDQLRALVDWKLKRLGSAAPELFARLSGFAGAVSSATVAAICKGGGIAAADVGQMLQNLQSSGFVISGGDFGTWRLRPSLMPLASEMLRLGSTEVGELDGAHFQYYMSVAERLRQHAMGLGPAVALDSIERELPDIRKALGWAQVNRGLGSVLRLAGSLAWFWARRGYQVEGASWLQDALSVALRGTGAPQVDPQDIFIGVHGLAYIQTHEEDYEGAAKNLELAAHTAEEAGDIPSLVLARDRITFVYARLGQVENAREAISVATREAESAKSDKLRAHCWIRSAFLHTLSSEPNDMTKAIELYEKAAQTLQSWENDERWELAQVNTSLGEAYRLTNNAERAIDCYKKALTEFGKIGDTWGLGLVLNDIAELLRTELAGEAAWSRYLEAAQRSLMAGNKTGLAHAMAGLAGVLTHMGSSREESARNKKLAAMLFGFADAFGPIARPVQLIEHDTLVQYCRDALGPQEFENQCRDGAESSLETILGWVNMGLAAPPV